ncbi:hypothetical protein GIB67_033898, partial [Kingdonia uniflora]
MGKLSKLTIYGWVNCLRSGLTYIVEIGNIWAGNYNMDIKWMCKVYILLFMIILFKWIGCIIHCSI